ncbi:MAG: FeoB-associated Cys-rich membrane protein [Clostridia bacterium]|nr:FeoB-associated Cys-rich membrane protein [Clostridia bacterium]
MTLIDALIVLFAVCIVAVEFVGFFRRNKKGGGCSGCSGCPHANGCPSKKRTEKSEENN